MERIELFWRFLCVLVAARAVAGCMQRAGGLADFRNTLTVRHGILASVFLAGVLVWAVGFGLSGASAESGVFARSPWFFIGPEAPGVAMNLLYLLAEAALCAALIAGAGKGRISPGALALPAGLIGGVGLPLLRLWQASPAGLGVSLPSAGWLQASGIEDVGGADLHLLAGFGGVVLAGLARRFSGETPCRPLAPAEAPAGDLKVLAGVLFLGAWTLSPFADVFPARLFHLLTVAAAGGLISWVACRAAQRREGGRALTLGMVAAVVSILPGYSVFSPESAVAVGTLGSLFSVLFRDMTDRRGHPDSSGVISGHLLPALWGCAAAVLLKTGASESLGLRLAGQTLYVLCAAAMAGGTMMLFGLLAVRLRRLTLSPGDEAVGYDVLRYGGASMLSRAVAALEFRSLTGETAEESVSLTKTTEMAETARAELSGEKSGRQEAQAVLDALAFPVLVFDAENLRLSFLNMAAQTAFGMPLSAAEGRPAARFFDVPAAQGELAAERMYQERMHGVRREDEDFRAWLVPMVDGAAHTVTCRRADGTQEEASCRLSLLCSEQSAFYTIWLSFDAGEALPEVLPEVATDWMAGEEKIQEEPGEAES